jgi:hypothetical protein
MTTAPKTSASPETVNAVVIAGAAICSALRQLVVSKSEIPNYAEWHARMRPIQIVGELKQKLIASRKRAKILSHKYQIAKEKLCR